MARIRSIAVYSFSLFLFVFFAPVFAQNQTLPANSSVEQMAQAFKKAMNRLDQEKDAREMALAHQLKNKLRIAADEWMKNIHQQKTQQVNNLVDQKWEKIAEFGPWFHYDYYLRDFEYRQKQFDVGKVDSLIDPYKGYVSVEESLYVEKQHSPEASDIAQFFHTVTRMINLTFDYKDGNFSLAKEDKAKESLVQGWPERIISKLKVR